MNRTRSNFVRIWKGHSTIIGVQMSSINNRLNVIESYLFI